MNVCVGYAKIYKTDLIGFWEKKLKIWNVHF